LGTLNIGNIVRNNGVSEYQRRAKEIARDAARQRMASRLAAVSATVPLRPKRRKKSDDRARRVRTPPIADGCADCRAWV